MAGFTFHIPYLIRMFTLLLYRWHTSGGFSYFDNFTVSEEPTTHDYEQVGYVLTSSRSYPHYESRINGLTLNITNVKVELVEVNTSNPSRKYHYKATINYNTESDFDTSPYRCIYMGGGLQTYFVHIDDTEVVRFMHSFDTDTFETDLYSSVPYMRITDSTFNSSIYTDWYLSPR